MKRYLIIFLLVSLTSCSEEFLEKNPKSEITEDTFFGPNTSELAVKRYVNNIYHTDNWAKWDRRWPWFAEVPADGFNHTTEFDVEGQQYDNHEFKSDQYNVFRMWNYIWWPIGQANLFLDKYDNLEEYHGDEWDDLEWFRGQVLFLRAYAYFVGVRMWGPIPVVTSPPEGKNHPNSSVPEVYERIVADLEEIVDNGYCPEWPNLPKEDMGRITMGAAKSLLAKVYLTRSYTDAAKDGDVGKAVEYARQVVEESNYGLFTEPILAENGDTLYTAYESVFLPRTDNGKEGIWEFQFTVGGAHSAAKYNEDFLPNGYYGNYGNGRFLATPLLYNSFELGDRRKEAYITGEVESPVTGQTLNLGDKIYTTKFHDPDPDHSAGEFENNFPLIRFADMLLIYAEALNKQNNGPTTEAFNAINRVRDRAGLPDLTGNYDFDSFLEAIQEERFKELAGESQRLFDLRRWGFNTLKERVEQSNPDASVEEHEVLWPIPDYELNNNPEIEQNPGY